MEPFVIGGGTLIFLVGVVVIASRFYRKVGPEEALIITGFGGLRVATGRGTIVIPVAHRAEQMDLSVTRIANARHGEYRLIGSIT